MEAKSLAQQQSLITAPPTHLPISHKKTLSPLLKTAEATPDPNEDLKLTGKRPKSNNSEKGENKVDGRWTKEEHAKFLEGKD
jgi:hypothetical protein